MTTLASPSTVEASSSAVQGRGFARSPAVPKTLAFDLVKWDGRLSCAYLHDFRIVGGKPWGGGTSVYSMKLRVSQLQDIIARAKARGSQSVCFEVYRHEDGEYAAYVDNELMLGSRSNARSCRPRRVGSTLVLLGREVRLSDFDRVHEVFRMPAAPTVS